MSISQNNSGNFSHRNYVLSSLMLVVGMDFIFWKGIWVSPVRVIGHSHSVHVTVAPVGISCKASHCYLQGSQLYMIDDSLLACVAPFSTMKTSQYWCKFQVFTTLILLCYMIQVCGIFSNRLILSSYGGLPRILALACDVWGSMELHWLSTPNKEAHSCPGIFTFVCTRDIVDLL